MIVEKIIIDNEISDKFPAGLRVLAVDDDPICLKLLETLLRKCQYQVTTMSQASMAVNILRENKDRFDLVISHVHMPDMDGFKLLELVGLEMDLPVIMFSGNSDPKLVMKGVTHGACDYLVKPVRIDELRNIWQDVPRRKQFDSKNQNASTDQVNTQRGSEEGHVSPTTGNADPHGKFNRKRKDEEDDNGNASEDPATQKKPSVVWSIELHRKFFAAVNHLGIEKAVPQRILDMMNVEGLTRENVASHLQKYRLYLKRISHDTTHQANMAHAFGIKDPPFMRMGSFDGLGDFRALSGPGRLGNVALSPYSTSGILGRNLLPNSLLPTDPFHPQLPLNSMRENNPSNGSYSQNNPIVASSVPLQCSRERSCHDLVSDALIMNQTTNQRWGKQKLNYRHAPNNSSSSLNSQNTENGIISSLNQSLEHNIGIFEQNMDEFVSGRSGGGVSSLVPSFAGTTKMMVLVITVFLLMLWWGF